MNSRVTVLGLDRANQLPNVSDQQDQDHPTNSQQVDEEQAVPFPFLEDDPVDSDIESDFDDSDGSGDLDDVLNGHPPDEPSDTKIHGIVHAYLVTVKNQITSAMEASHLPPCYRSGQFWIYPQHPYFAMSKAEKIPDGLNPTSLYHPSVFLWLPHLLDTRPITCPNAKCRWHSDQAHPMTIKGWNDDPVARRVVGLDQNYYIMTMRIQCRARSDQPALGGCGKSYNLYDPLVLEQFDSRLVASFPAFLTHRSGIDKTFMTLIRAGMSHRVSASAWSAILRELHVREHDLCELQYLHTIQMHVKQAVNQNEPKAYLPFSEFDDKGGYAGFYPSRWYITNVYVDYMEHIRPILDQCMSALTGHVIKWDHSFKLPKYLMKLDGVMSFAALFTVVNEFEQIRYQAFVPTKALSHIRSGLEAMVKSLSDHGLAQPVLGFTDNVASDAATFLQCIPSLGENVTPVEFDEFDDLPRLSLPSDVTPLVCNTEAEIESACLDILGMLVDGSKLHIGFDMEWEFSTEGGSLGSNKTALVQLALQKKVYLLRVYVLKNCQVHYKPF